MMRLILLTLLTLSAFAANSLINRLAVGQGLIGAGDFALIRLAAGAGMLSLCLWIIARKRPDLGRARLLGGLFLSVYMVGFSWAYLGLDAGLGALILFGVVQITMGLGGARAARDWPPRRIVGLALAFAGLVWLLWPKGTLHLPLGAVAAMGAAGVGWGIYSILGRGARDPLAQTAGNFIVALPLSALAIALLPAPETALTLAGVLWACLAGAVTSGLGYALWYAILPSLGPARAGLAQLAVPPIAVIGGVVFLGETLTAEIVFAGGLVLGGVALGLIQRKISSSGS